MPAPKGNQYAKGNNGGRPTRYLKKYCAKAIELGKLGKSQVQIACALDVDPKTLRDWANSHKEFALALSRAKAFEQDFWEDLALTNIKEREFQAAVWKKSMEARFREDYTTIQKQELTGKGGGPVEVAVSETDRFISEVIESEETGAFEEPDQD